MDRYDAASAHAPSERVESAHQLAQDGRGHVAAEVCAQPRVDLEDGEAAVGAHLVVEVADA
eukprot:CAMPEP_0195569382 /NCGR_PEP_ID=MMETSP0814-20130614/2792_1 /TAXON_ID=97485 /ORGANISM="Prymnesium parvum, Strain Texoma1" /LENGTH=60 /DNA_ID=CAMNT_0040704761 /DNA_START=98 /DNA_END=278 /DNA_ORIENTATION=-